MLLILALSALQAAASACPDFSGTWDVAYDYGGRTVDQVVQEGCARLRTSTRLVHEGQTLSFTYVIEMDGKFRAIKNEETGKVDGHGAYYLLGEKHIMIFIMDPGYTGKLEIGTVTTTSAGPGQVRIVKVVSDGDGQVIFRSVGIGTRRPPTPKTR